MRAMHAAGLMVVGLLMLAGCSNHVASSERRTLADSPDAATARRDAEISRAAVAEFAEAAELVADEAAPVPAPGHEFVGTKRCGMCHRTAKIGEQLQHWQASRHAHAFETLDTPEAHEVASQFGIDDPQQSGQCLKCHSTAYWFSTELVSTQIPVEDGVSCETCHGPGKDYMGMSVMKDHEAAVAAGLLVPDEQTCRQCHNQTGPNPVPFDFAKSWDKIKHPIPQ